MTEALAFWGVAIVIAALALPLAFRLLARFPDAGAGLSFTLGLTLVGAGYFVLRYLGALPAGRGGFLLAIGLFGVAMVIVAVRDRRILATLRRSLPGLTVAVALFSALFFGYAFFRAHVPDIAHTEQPMDLLYLNAMLVSPDYPPHDPWFAGKDASYHYGGYLQAAVLTGASDVWPASGYNLALAAFFASAGAAAFSLCAALARWLFGRRAHRWVTLAATGAVLLLLFAGPLASVFEFAAAHGADHEGVYDAFGAEGLVRCGAGAGESCTGQPLDPTNRWYPDDHWVWWRMSRMANWGPQPSYPFTVTEVPAFSFLLGDLHPHVMSIPGVLLALAVCAALWRGRGRLDWNEHHRRPWLLVAVAVVFGSLAFVNVWDVIAFSPLLALAVFARNRRTRSFGESIGDTVSWLLPPALLSIALFAPWWSDFSPQRGGIYGYSGQGTRIEHVLLMWGVPIVFALAGLWWGVKSWRRDVPGAPVFVALLLTLLPFLIWLPFAAFERTAAPFDVGDGLLVSFGARTAGAWVTLVFFAAAFWLLASATFILSRRSHPAAPVAALAALGVFLLYGTEFFLLRDALFFLPRLNTVFKLSYQGWIVLSLAGAIGGVAVLRAAAPGWRPIVAAPLAILLGSALVFAVTNTPNRAGDFAVLVGLDGLRYVERHDPAEYDLVRWLNDNVERDAIVVESSGRLWGRGDDGRPVLREGATSYNSAVSRVGYRTGLQTPIGWPGHETTWRGNSDELVAELVQRQDLVDRVYTASTSREVLAALDELGATYVLVGSLERSHYPADLIPAFETFLDTVFSQGAVALYRVPSVEEVVTQ